MTKLISDAAKKRLRKTTIDLLDDSLDDGIDIDGSEGLIQLLYDTGNGDIWCFVFEDEGRYYLTQSDAEKLRSA